MPLTLAGDKVSGTIKSAGTCDFANGLFFPSVDISVEVAARGSWRSRAPLSTVPGRQRNGMRQPAGAGALSSSAVTSRVFMGPDRNGELTDAHPHRRRRQLPRLFLSPARPEFRHRHRAREYRAAGDGSHLS